MPTFNSFDFFQNLLPLLVVLVPLLMLARSAVPRQVVFVVAGTYLLFLIAPRLALAELLAWAAVAALQPVVAHTGDRRGGMAVLTVGLAAVLAPMVAWKLFPVRFVVDFNSWSNRLIRVGPDTLASLDFTAKVVIPLGLSFATFRAADLLIKSNLGIYAALPPGRVMAYGLFPSVLVVGPIASYDEVATTLSGSVPLDRDRLLRGALQILEGLAKVFVLSWPLSWSLEVLTNFPWNSAPRLWVGMIAFGWYFYLNFAGYSDIAIGTARLLGADLRPNFDWPYRQTSPTSFWNSWHISLTRFVRQNVYTPIVAADRRLQYVGTVVTMVLIGLWHSITWATLVFGLYHAAGLLAHRVVSARRPPRTTPGWRIAKAATVFVWFTLSLPLLELSLHDSGALYRALIFGGRAA
jgi:D-alanyl-lipoteichoic acid acyltransferase DltB (MBOAT superfamily)